MVFILNSLIVALVTCGISFNAYWIILCDKPVLLKVGLPRSGEGWGLVQQQEHVSWQEGICCHWLSIKPRCKIWRSGWGAAILLGKKTTGVDDPVSRTSNHQQEFFPKLWEEQQSLQPLREQGLGSKQGWHAVILGPITKAAEYGFSSGTSFTCPVKASSRISIPSFGMSWGGGGTKGLHIPALESLSGGRGRTGKNTAVPAPLSGHQGSEGMGDAGSSKFQIFLSGGSLGIWNFLEVFFLAM